MQSFVDVRYASIGARDLYLDLYLPDSGPAAPQLLVWIHGGAWRQGSKENPPLLPFVDEGYALASITYRFSQQATFPAQIHDCKGAIRWLRANAGHYGYSGERIGVAGASAGGHLAALLGTSGGVSQLEGDVGNHLGLSSRVQAVVDLFGPTNFLAMLGRPSAMDHAAPDSPESQLVGGSIEDHPDRVRQADPITYATADSPPFLIIHGNQDPLVPPQQSEILHAALTVANVESTLEIIEGAGHGGPAFFDAQRWAMMRAFWDRHLR